MSIEPLVEPDAFVGLEEVTHLCTGGEAPWLKGLEDVYAEFARLKSGGGKGRDEIFRLGEECRKKMGRLWGVPSQRVGFVPCAAEGMNLLARGIDWRPGDNVVTNNLEFPSVAYAWRALRQQGVEVRLVGHRNWAVEEEELLAAVDGRTRVLAVSQVSFYTGQNLDIARLSAGVSDRDCLFAVDATHAAGVVQVPAGLTDLCVSSAYKWLLATHGVAPCFLSDAAEAQLKVTTFGWHNLAVWPAQGAERHPHVELKPMPALLEPGNPAMVVVLFLNRTLELILELGIDQIENHARDLSAQIRGVLQGRGLTVITPAGRQRHSGNTCFAAEDAKGVQERLEAEGVLVWGEYGRVRVSGHLYNGSKDVEALQAALDRVGLAG